MCSLFSWCGTKDGLCPTCARVRAETRAARLALESANVKVEAEHVLTSYLSVMRDTRDIIGLIYSRYNWGTLRYSIQGNYDDSTLAPIQQSLSAGIPVIACLASPSGLYKSQLYLPVCIVDLDQSNKTVCYKDPLLGDKIQTEAFDDKSSTDDFFKRFTIQRSVKQQDKHVSKDLTFFCQDLIFTIKPSWYSHYSSQLNVLRFPADLTKLVEAYVGVDLTWTHGPSTKPKRSESEIAAKAIEKYDKSDKSSIRLRDISEFNLKEVQRHTRLEWEATAFVETGGDIHRNRYFYRAMKTDEYLHLRKHGYIPQGTDGHQGLAPNRSYCKKYLKDGYTHLVEFNIPSEFFQEMYRQGWKEGSVEDDCLAWGLAVTHKNTWKNNDERGVQTVAKLKNTAKTPYDIYLSFKDRIAWRLVNMQIAK